MKLAVPLLRRVPGVCQRITGADGVMGEGGSLLRWLLCWGCACDGTAGQAGTRAEVGWRGRRCWTLSLFCGHAIGGSDTRTTPGPE
jgi:hypothetical protein